MNIGEFLIALGVKADTKGLKDTQEGLKGVESQANKTDKTLSSFSSKLSGFFKGFALFSTAALTAVKTVMVGAWAFFDSTINKVEELTKAEDESIRTTKEQVEMVKKYRENMDQMGKIIDSVKTRIAFAFLPAMYEMSKQYRNLLDNNKELIENGIKKFLSIVTSASQVITNFFRFINKAVEATVGWKNALIILVGVFAWIKRGMLLAFATNPIFWIIAAIGVLLILIDDFMTYLDGGESEFGEFWGASLKWIEDNKDAINAIKQVFVDFVEFLTGIVALIVGIFTGDTALMSAAWEGMIENFIAAWNGLAMFFEPAAEFITNTINNAFDRAKKFVLDILNSMLNAIKSFISALGTIFTNVFSLITAPFAQAFDWIVNKFSELPSIIGGIASKLTFGLSDKIGSAVTNTANRISNYTSTTTASIQVNGATNPQVTANAINANLNSMTQNNMGGVVKA